MGRYSRVERRGRIMIVTIDRPEVLNALHGEASEELSREFDEFERDPELRVAVITGAGNRAFSAGNDLKHASSGGAPSFPETGFGGLTERRDMTKPVIAAVNALAIGGGFELALACDLIVAAQQAEFALREVHVGLIALSGIRRLTHDIGPKQAASIVLTGRRVSAEEGLALGFVNEVVAHGSALDAALEWASRIIEGSPLAVRAAKQTMSRTASPVPVQSSEQLRYPAVAELLASDDPREGALAFTEKRPPRWRED